MKIEHFKAFRNNIIQLSFIEKKFAMEYLVRTNSFNFSLNKKIKINMCKMSHIQRPAKATKLFHRVIVELKTSAFYAHATS